MGMPPPAVLRAILGGGEHNTPKPVKPARDKVFEHTGMDVDGKLGDTITVDAPRAEWLYFIGYVSTMENIPQAIADMVRHMYECAMGVDFDTLNAEIAKRYAEHMAEEHSDMEGVQPFQLLDLDSDGDSDGPSPYM